MMRHRHIVVSISDYSPPKFDSRWASMADTAADYASYPRLPANEENLTHFSLDVLSASLVFILGSHIVRRGSEEGYCVDYYRSAISVNMLK